MTLITGDGVWDALGTAMIGVLLVVIAIILAIETKSLLLGEGAETHDVAAIEKAITEGPEVERIIHMKTLYLGPEELMVAAKIGVSARHSAEELARGINTVEARIRAAVPIARVIYLEPDVYSAAAERAGTGAASHTAVPGSETEPGDVAGRAGG